MNIGFGVEIGMNQKSGQSAPPTFYLSMDGVNDWIATPSVTYDQIVMDVEVDALSPNSNLYLVNANGGTRLDAQPIGTMFSYVQKSNMTLFRNNISSMKINGGASVSSSVVTSNQRFSVDYGFPALTDPSTEFFASQNGTAINRTKGKIYRITGYYLGGIVFDYDMSTGTVQDQSGNGNHATLIGGTWVAE